VSSLPVSKSESDAEANDDDDEEEEDDDDEADSKGEEVDFFDIESTLKCFVVCV
jgi:hypothetical protein